MKNSPIVEWWHYATTHSCRVSATRWNSAEELEAADDRRSETAESQDIGETFDSLVAGAVGDLSDEDGDEHGSQTADEELFRSQHVCVPFSYPQRERTAIAAD